MHLYSWKNTEKKSLSVRQTESLVRFLKKGSSKKIFKDPNVTATEQELTEKIGMKVSLINKKKNSGSVTFEFKNYDQLDRLISVIKKNY